MWAEAETELAAAGREQAAEERAKGGVAKAEAGQRALQGKG